MWLLCATAGLFVTLGLLELLFARRDGDALFAAVLVGIGALFFCTWIIVRELRRLGSGVARKRQCLRCMEMVSESAEVCAHCGDELPLG